MEKFFLYFKTKELPRTYEDGEELIESFERWKRNISENFDEFSLQLIGEFSNGKLNFLSGKERSVYGFVIISASSINDVIEIINKIPSEWVGDVEISKVIDMNR
ncbi:hypothetical protein [uncultured Cohaesibacter sp.]|uniref:hypothetical protein n=1 Tax=uncultured Cohaesibacter sp. TaxID=1002546 RepID=UPI0029C69030|nr:hypothetical protein [uncultured Cohaesibacter sp.]